MSNYYSDHSPCDWRAGLSIFIMAALFCLGWCTCAYVGLRLGEMAGHPAIGVLSGAFGIPILAILVNGQMAMIAEKGK